MATLEEKILGERRENYCSSSEESEHGDSDNEELCGGDPKSDEVAATLAPPNEWNGTASNTGPKGVLKDWEQFKLYETQMRQEREMSRAAQLERLVLTCQTSAEEEQRRKEEEEMEEELRELEEGEEEFLLQYGRERMREMQRRLQGGEEERRVFGSLIHITSADQFLSEIDNEPSHVTIIIHLHSPSLLACRSLNTSLSELARDYPNTKFTSVKLGLVSDHLSSRFKASALPCLLVYRGGAKGKGGGAKGEGGANGGEGGCVASFVRLAEEWGDQVFSEEVERFLLDHGVLVAPISSTS